jgi:hypothetical protein
MSCTDWIRKSEEERRKGNTFLADYYLKEYYKCYEKTLFLAGFDIFKQETEALNDQMVINPEIAYNISEGLERGFSDAKIQFDKDMTFAALLFVIEKPQFSGQVISEIGGKLQFLYLTEPYIMKNAGAKIDRERINQGPEPQPSGHTPEPASYFFEMNSTLGILNLIDRDKTNELNSRMAMHPGIAYTISMGLDQGISNSKIEFGPKTSYAAALYVIHKPEFLGQVLSSAGGKLQFSYITSSDIMRIACKRIQQERITLKPFKAV